MNAKQKGNKGEKEWAECLRQSGLDSAAGRNYSSGNNTQKSDVHNSLNYNFEVKRVEKLNIFKAIDQTEKDCAMTHAKPAVVFRRNNDDWWIALPWHDWAQLEKRAREPKTAKTENRELQWALVSLRNALSKVQKLVA